jgi:hypothetical protein
MDNCDNLLGGLALSDIGKDFDTKNAVASRPHLTEISLHIVNMTNQYNISGFYPLL